MREGSCLTLWVTLVGRPNAGKSSLINAIFGRDWSIVSGRCQSTRDVIHLLYESGDLQLILTDTPGIDRPLDELGRLVRQRSDAAVRSAEWILYLSPIDTRLGHYDREISGLLAEHSQKIALITKLDRLSSPERLRERVEELRGLGFESILSCSVKYPDSIAGLVRYLRSLSKEGERLEVSGPFLNLDKGFLAREAIRLAVYESLSLEVPHGVAVVVNSLEETERELRVRASIYVVRRSQVGILIGRGGVRIGEIRRRALRRLSSLTNLPTRLELRVRLAKK